MPELFQELRGLIDQGRRAGRRTGRFLVLGSASMDLMRQSGESLAGRIEYVELHGLDVLEAARDATSDDLLWLRGGFPDSLLAATDEDSFAYRRNLVRTYLERDVPQFGFRIAAETLERFWTMLAHGQGALLNASTLAASLSVSAPTVTAYVDLLADLLLLRRLTPWRANVRKRLVKSPKVYVRDSGLIHALLGIEDIVVPFDLKRYTVTEAVHLVSRRIRCHRIDYGASTTHMSKLLPRIEGGGGAGCPLLVFGISRKLYLEDDA